MEYIITFFQNIEQLGLQYWKNNVKPMMLLMYAV
jgi:hypothetical protein